MIKLLDLPQTAFQEGKLKFVEPETWKNVGASVIHAVRIIKDHYLENIAYVEPLR